MSILPFDWGQTAQSAPAKTSPGPEGSAVPEINNGIDASSGSLQEEFDPTAIQPQARGFLHIVRHGAGPLAIYVLTYHRLDFSGNTETKTRPVLAEGAQSLIGLLEQLGVDFGLKDVRGALQDILRLGSCNIPDLWLSDEDILKKGLVES